MHYGEIIEQGTPEQLFNFPQSSQLKEYMIEGN